MSTKTWPPSSDRVTVALNANFQMEAMVNALMAARSAGDPENLEFLILGIGTRLKELTGVMTSALSDPGAQPATLNRQLGYGI